MPNPSHSGETPRSFVQISRFRQASLINPHKASEDVKRALTYGLSPMIIRARVQDVTGRNEAEVLDIVPREVYTPHQGRDFGVAVKLYTMSPTGRVTLKNIIPSGVSVLLKYELDTDFKSAWVQTGFDGEFIPEGNDPSLGYLQYTEVRSSILAGMEAAEETRATLRSNPPSGGISDLGFQSRFHGEIISEERIDRFIINIDNKSQDSKSSY